MAKRTFAFVAVFAALLSVTLSVQADDLNYYWAGGSGSNYFTTANWRIGSESGSVATAGLGDTANSITAYIRNSNSVISLDYSNLGGAVKTLNLGGGTATPTLTRSGGTLNIQADRAFNVLDNGTFNISQGFTIDANGKMTVDGGTVSDTGAGLLVNGTLDINKGTFTFNNSGNQIQANGTINVRGGKFNVAASNSMRIGNAANSTLNISGGEVTVSSPSYIGVSNYTGTINQSGGNVTFNGELDLGWGNGAVGEYNLTGGTMTTNKVAGLWTDNPNGISTFTVDGGTANFSYTQDGSTVDSFTVGLTGNNQLANVFTLSSGTVNVADTFRVRNSGILNVSGGTFDTKGLAIDSGTFTQTGGSITAETFTLASSGTYHPNPGSTFNVTEGSGTATLNGTIDLSGFSGYVGENGDTLTVISATTFSGTPTYTNQPSKWTRSIVENNGIYSVILTYNGSGDYIWSGTETDGEGRYRFNTANNWKVGGTQIESGGQLSDLTDDVNCYILDTIKDGNLIKVWIDNSALGVKSLTVGKGNNTQTAQVYSPDALELSDTITINKGGFVEIKSIDIINGGKLIITGGTLNLCSASTNSPAGLKNSVGAYTITLSGGTFGNYHIDDPNNSHNPNWTSSLNATISANEVTFAPSEGNTITWSGVLSGDGGVIVDGAGTLTLSGANTYAGGTKITNGTLKMTDTGSLTGAVVNNDTLELNVTSALTFSNTVSGTGVIKKTGDGTLTLSSASNESIACDMIIESGIVALNNEVGKKDRFTGTVTVNKDATLRFDAHDCTGYLGSKAATFNLYGGTLELNVSSAPMNETLTNKTINLKAGTIKTLNNASSTLDIFNNGNALHVEANNDATPDNPTVSYVKGWLRLRNTQKFYINVDDNAKLIIGEEYGGITYGSEHNYPLVKQGAGVLVFKGANTYTKGTVISEGTLILTENGTLGTGNVTNNATLEFAHAADRTGANAISNVISGTGAVNKTGAGTLELSGANTYSGGTTISTGTLKLSGSGALGTGNIVDNATLEFAHTADLTGDNALTNAISGTGKVTKTGSGTLELKGANTYSGGTTISAGTLKLSNNNLPGTGNVTLENNGILEFANNDGLTFSKVISGTGSVTKSGSGVLHVSGANTYSGGTKISSGGAIRLIDNNATLGTGPINLASGDLRFSGDVTSMTVSNDITGSGNITKQGTNNATVTLSGDLSGFTGILTTNGASDQRGCTIKLYGANANLLNASAVVNDGTIDVSDYSGSTTMQLNKLSGAGIVNIGSKPIILNNAASADSTTFSGVINGTSGLTKTGTGTLTLSGANTYTGMTTVSAGVLKLTGDAVVANGPVTVGDNGSLVYNVDGEPEPLTIGTTNKIFSTGQVIKTGDGTLKLCALYAEADKMIDVQSLTVSSGRVDIKEYFYGKLIVDSEGTFSPGNSVGSLTIGDGTYGGGFILNEAGAELLMEIGGSAASANDVLIVEGDITLADGSVITLVNNSNLGLGESFTAILSAENSANLDVLGHIQTTDFTDLKYVEINDANHGTVYAITGRRFTANEIPEPSTWALLILGAAGLLYWRKKKNA